MDMEAILGNVFDRHPYSPVDPMFSTHLDRDTAGVYHPCAFIF